ncbi:hypothetical protein SteCoe_20467 [Stentor coeruleus]|uniref:Uncharacterized protein n=1 Tax=Stentor coeruleus TaxID=5963 RepID=A0A1R2BRP2_9CILI|nr:hypothetical protein SteCoe_20467 [Stentor coeruleus]
MELLQKALKLKQEDSKLFAKALQEKDTYIQGLKKIISKLENRLNHEKMILQFREETITSLQQNNYDENQQIKDLKKEVMSLKEQIDSNFSATGIQVENERLTSELNSLKSTTKNNFESLQQKLSSFEEINCSLADELLQSQKVNFSLKQISNSQKIKSKNYKSVKIDLERTVSELKEKITELELMNLTLKSDGNMNFEESNMVESKESEDEMLLNSYRGESTCEKIDEVLNRVNKQQNSLGKKILHNSNYEQKINELMDKNRDLEERLRISLEKSSDRNEEKFEKEIEKLSCDFTFLKTQYKIKENESETTKKEIDSLKNTIESLNKTISETKNLLLSSENKKSSLENELNEAKKLKKTLDELQFQLSESNDNFKKTVDQNESFKLKIENLSNENERLNGLFKNAMEKLEIYKDEVNKIHEEKKIIASELEENQKSKKNIEDMVGYYKETYLKVLHNFEESKIENEETLTKLKLEKEKLEIIEESLESIKLEFARSKLEYESKYQEACEEIKHLDQELSKERRSYQPKKDAETRSRQYEDELKILKNSADNFQELNLTLTQKNAELKLEVSKLKEKLSIEDNSQIKYLKNCLIKKDHELAELKEKGQVYYSQADEVLESMRKRCLNLQSEVGVLKNELKSGNTSFCNISRPRRGSVALRENPELVNKSPIKNPDDTILLKNVNGKLTEELRKNVEINEILQKRIIDMEKKIGELEVCLKKYEEEINNLAGGLAQITGFVFGLPCINFNPGQNNLIESTIQAIAFIYDMARDRRYTKPCY